MFKQLSGNPLAITLLACCRANPLHQSRTLKNIYELLKSEEILSVLREEGPDLKDNEISLCKSSEALILLLKDSYPEACSFLYFLAMLPTGALPNQLTFMWGSQYEK